MYVQILTIFVYCLAFIFWAGVIGAGICLMVLGFEYVDEIWEKETGVKKNGD